MTRRPKLSLSAGNRTDKKQAPGFETVTPSDASETPPSATETPLDNLEEAQDPAKGHGTTVPKSAARSDGGKLAKVLLAIVAAALSLYLIKRRWL